MNGPLDEVQADGEERDRGLPGVRQAQPQCGEVALADFEHVGDQVDAGERDRRQPPGAGARLGPGSPPARPVEGDTRHLWGAGHRWAARGGSDTSWAGRCGGGRDVLRRVSLRPISIRRSIAKSPNSIRDQAQDRQAGVVSPVVDRVDPSDQPGGRRHRWEVRPPGPGAVGAWPRAATGRPRRSGPSAPSGRSGSPRGTSAPTDRPGAAGTPGRMALALGRPRLSRRSFAVEATALAPDLDQPGPDRLGRGRRW